MSKPSRLFDCLDIQEQNPIADLMGKKEHGSYTTMSSKEVVKTVYEISNGLLSIGVSENDRTTEGRDKVGIIANNRPEWLITDLAVQQAGAILVPLYPTITDKDLVFCFNQAAIKACFVSDEKIYQKLANVKEQIPTLQAIYSFDKISGVKHWEELFKPVSDSDKARIEAVKSNIGENDIATLIYTSGTTGVPKGVMLSHKNVVSNVLAVAPVVTGIGGQAERRALSFLPLNHILERMVSYVYLFYGFSIYYAESMETIGDNLKEVKPNIFVTVPRLLEKVYEKIMTTGAQLSGIKKSLFFWAIALGNKYDPSVKQSWWYNFQLKIANKLIFSKWREALGGNVKAIVVGGAACQQRLARIFSSADITIMEGYGLTETSPVIAVNHYDKENRRIGTVGPIIDTVEVKIAGDGEILCKGPNIMSGYYKNPEATQESYTNDGWFKTGDIGEMVDNKFLKITDRKKELFKTSGGKYVAPQPIENKFKESRFIEQIMLVGEEQKFVSALIVPNFENLKKWMSNQNIPYSDNQSAIKEPSVIAMYQDIIDKFNPNFSHVEQVKKFVLLDKEWGIDSGELTPKLSMKRKVILNKNEEIISKIYNTGN